MTAFAVESARDLVNYMVRRGQMTQEEADKLIREAEEASSKRAKMPKPPAAEPKVKAPPKPKASAPAAAKKPAAPAAKKSAPKKPAAKK
jgi:hypothetical protein